MKPGRIYFLLLSLAYALLLLLGNREDLSAESQWRAEAAAWLGEPPAGLRSETIRAGKLGDFPVTVYAIPSDDELRRKIIGTFSLEKFEGLAVGAEEYGNKHVLPDYPAECRPEGGVSVCITPWLLVNPDGSMLFCVDNPNVEQGTYPVVPLVEHPYPQYLPRGNWALLFRELMLAVLCFMFPALFCCVGWLWVQRRSPRDAETKRICLLIPLLVGMLGAVADFLWHGFDVSYTLFCAAFAAGANGIVALVLMGLTALVRKMSGKQL